MKKSLLVFVSVVVFHSTISYADSKSELPPLPASEIKLEEKNDLGNNKSFWQKIKEYIGFSKEEKVVESQPVTQLPDEQAKSKEQTKEQTAESKPIDSNETVIDSKNNSSASIPPIGSTDEGPVNVKLPEKIDNEPEVPDQIKLPEGFGEEGITNNNSTSLGEPTQDISNLDKVVPKNNMTEISPLQDGMASTQAIPKSATEEVTVPQLPGDNKSEGSDTKASTATLEPVADNLTIPQLPGDNKSEGSDTKASTATLEPVADNLTIPQLPGDNKNEGSDTKASTATLEPVADNLTIPQLPGDNKNEGSDTKPSTATLEPAVDNLTAPQLPEDNKNEGADTKSTIEITQPKTDKEPIQKDEPSTELVLPDKNLSNSTNPPDITVPEYANQVNQVDEEEVAIAKYKKELETKSNKPTIVPKISESELSLKDKAKQGDLKASDLEEFDAKQLKFVNNEAQVLILPNDDIVLGELTDEAKLDQMDFRLYIDRFWKNYDRLRREPRRIEIEKFIDNYDELFDTNNSPYEER